MAPADEHTEQISISQSLSLDKHTLFLSLIYLFNNSIHLVILLSKNIFSQDNEHLFLNLDMKNMLSAIIKTRKPTHAKYANGVICNQQLSFIHMLR